MKVRILNRSYRIRGVLYEQGKEYLVDRGLSDWMLSRKPPIAERVPEVEEIEEIPEFKPVPEVKPAPTKTAYDKLLGLLETPHLAEIYGPFGSGKTNLVYHIALEAQQAGKEVYYFDTEAGVPESWADRLEHYEYTDDLMTLARRIRELAETGPTENGLIVVDSLAGYTPLILFDSQGKIHIDTIEDFFYSIPTAPTTTLNGEEIKPVEDWKVLEIGYKKGIWKSIKRVIRHPFEGELIRVNTGAGLIDLSPNHPVVSDFRGRGELVKAGKIGMGDTLSIPDITQLASYHSGSLFIGSRKVAWLYGLFAADGWATDYVHAGGRGPNRERRRTKLVGIDNKNSSVIDEACSIFENELNKKPCVHCRKDGVTRIECYGVETFDHFRMFYTRSGMKRVPSLILNAPKAIKKAFVDGFVAGDGAKKIRSAYRFDGDSHPLQAGLIWIIHGFGGNSWYIGVRDDKPRVVSVTINKGRKNTKIDPRAVKWIGPTKYKGYLYDLEVEGHTFSAGIGPIRIHNSIGYPLYARYKELIDREPGKRFTAWQDLLPATRWAVRFARGIPGEKRGEWVRRCRNLSIMTNQPVSEICRESPEDFLKPFGGKLTFLPKLVVHSEPAERNGEFRLVSYKSIKFRRGQELARFRITDKGVATDWLV